MLKFELIKVSEEKNIINYTAADIEKYWKGKLSACRNACNGKSGNG